MVVACFAAILLSRSLTLKMRFGQHSMSEAALIGIKQLCSTELFPCLPPSLVTLDLYLDEACLGTVTPTLAKTLENPSFLPLPESCDCLFNDVSTNYILNETVTKMNCILDRSRFLASKRGVLVRNCRSLKAHDQLVSGSIALPVSHIDLAILSQFVSLEQL